MSILRSVAAIVFVAAAYLFLMFGEPVPAKIEMALCVVVILIGLSVIRWASTSEPQR